MGLSEMDDVIQTQDLRGTEKPQAREGGQM
jgi:hypothetical protein